MVRIVKKRPIKTFKETFTDECCDDDTCLCNCHSDDDDYMLERVSDMQNDINFMIQVLEHRKEKEQTYQDILSYEDDEEETEEIDVEQLLKDINDFINRPVPRIYPWTVNKYPKYPQNNVWYHYR